MWEISVLSQFNSSVFALVFGNFLAIQYFIISELIAAKRNKLSVIISDIVFWIITSFEYFIVNLRFSNGKIRLILLLFSAAGFIVFYKYFSFIRIVLRKLFARTRKIYAFITYSLQEMIFKAYGKLKKIAKKVKKFLLKCSVMMYTVFSKRKMKGRD